MLGVSRLHVPDNGHYRKRFCAARKGGNRAPETLWHASLSRPVPACPRAAASECRAVVICARRPANCDPEPNRLSLARLPLRLNGALQLVHCCSFRLKPLAPDYRRAVRPHPRPPTAKTAQRHPGKYEPGSRPSQSVCSCAISWQCNNLKNRVPISAWRL